MPILRDLEVGKTTKLYMWEVSESIESLSAGLKLSHNCNTRLDKMKSLQSAKNFLAVRQILKQESYDPSDLFYNEHGKPFLKDGRCISISHTANYVGVAFDETEVGLDVERVREKILRVVDKFSKIDTRMSSISRENMLLKLTKIWSAKEAIYKAHNTPGLRIKDQILIKNFFPLDTYSMAKVIEEHKETPYGIYFLSIEEINDLVISYCKPN